MSSKPFLCDDCGEEFEVELIAYNHAVENNHTVRYWGKGPKNSQIA